MLKLLVAPVLDAVGGAEQKKEKVRPVEEKAPEETRPEFPRVF